MEKKAIILSIIILIALFLRLFNLNYMEFKYDEAFNSFKTLEMVKEGKIPLVGDINSIGIHMPPLFIYLLSIPFFFSRNPVIATGFIALMNVIAILITFFFMKKFFSEKAAFITIAFYAVSPWQVLFSRKIWAQDLLTPFIILFIFFIYKIVYEKKQVYIIYSLITLGFICQIHLSSIYFLFISLIITVWQWQKINKKYLIIGIIFFILMFTPYLIYQLKNDFVDIKTFKSGSKFTVNIDVFKFPFKLITTRGFEYVLGNNYSDFKNKTLIITLLDILQMISLLIAFIYLFITYKKNIIFVIWLLSGILFLVFVRSLYNHYFISLLPLMFILIGNMFNWLLKNKLGILRYTAYGIILVLLIYQFSFSLSFVNYIKEQKCIDGDYGVPFAYHLKDIKEAINEGNEEFEQIHASCKCVKCDKLATLYIMEYINKESVIKYIDFD